jgi:hypothetical protein
MKLKHHLLGLIFAYLSWVAYLLFSPIEVYGRVMSSCFEAGCVVFEGDWIHFGKATYQHEVFTDEIPEPQRVPYTEYEGKLVKFGNYYHLVGAHMDSQMYIAVEHADSVSLLKLPWFVLYTISGYLPAYRHVEVLP